MLWEDNEIVNIGAGKTVMYYSQDVFITAWDIGTMIFYMFIPYTPYIIFVIFLPIVTSTWEIFEQI